MHLDDLTITAFCLIDDMLKEILANRRLKQRDPMPLLADSAVLATEVAGEYPELSKDKAIYDYFRRHYSHLFPAMAEGASHHIHGAGCESARSQKAHLAADAPRLAQR